MFYLCWCVCMYLCVGCTWDYMRVGCMCKCVCWGCVWHVFWVVWGYVYVCMCVGGTCMSMLRVCVCRCVCVLCWGIMRRGRKNNIIWGRICQPNTVQWRKNIYYCVITLSQKGTGGKNQHNKTYQ